jgi:hypothetical protein
MEDKLNRLVAAKRRIRRAWRPLQQRLGAAGIAGVALLAAAAIGLLYAPQILLEADSMHFAVDRTRARLAEIDRELAATPGSVRQLDRFHTWLPPFRQSTSDLKTLFDIAAKSQIQLIKGEYALKQDNAHHIARLEIVLPIKDTYRDIRGFVAATLDALPHASLSELRMERSAPNVEPLDARLRITMFYRDR